MKKLISFTTFKAIRVLPIILIMLATLSSCKKDDTSSSTSNTSVLNSTVQQGSWKVTSYIDSGTDETNHYTGYVFTFQTGGVVSAVKTGSTVNGTWSSGNDDSQLKLILNFGTTAPFQELNSDWHVTQQSSIMIKLEDISGGNGGIDYLTLEKI